MKDPNGMEVYMVLGTILLNDFEMMYNEPTPALENHFSCF